MTFTFGTLCSGIDAAALAFQGVGADQRFAAEIDAFCCVLLATRYDVGVPKALPLDHPPAQVRHIEAFFGQRPEGAIPNFGDILLLDAKKLPQVDLLVSGTPCQDFSQAGAGAGLTGPNGRLTTRFLEIVHDLVPRGLRAVVWENVPRVLTAPDNVFGAILGGLVGSDTPIDNPWYGGKWPRAGVAVGPQGAAAWRVLDAQYFGLAQRRERLFVVAGVGPSAIDPVAVLFERRGLSKAHPRRDKGEQDHAVDLLEGRWPPVAFTLRTRDTGPVPEVEPHDVFPTLRASQGGSTRPFIVAPEGVRRMTPEEAERLMGFPPGFTDIPWPPRHARKVRDADATAGYALQSTGSRIPRAQGNASSGMRFSALGNSKPVPILRALSGALAFQLECNQQSSVALTGDAKATGNIHV